MVRNMFYTHYRRNIQHLAVKSSQFNVCCTQFSFRYRRQAYVLEVDFFAQEWCGGIFEYGVKLYVYEPPLDATYLIMFIIITQKQLNYLRFG